MVWMPLLAWMAFPHTAAASPVERLERWHRHAQCVGNLRPIDLGAGAPLRVAHTVAGRLLGHKTPTPSFTGRGADVARFELTFALARIGPKTGPQPTMAAALKAARSIGQANRRHQALIAGVRWLHQAGDRAESQRWQNAMTVSDHAYEARAHRAILDGRNGDLKSAETRLNKLPPVWGRYVMPTNWPNYPAELGSQGAALCTLMASPRVSAHPGARKLIAAAVKALEPVRRDWQSDLAWRGLALAWSFAGDEARALAAAARIGGGSSRATVVGLIVERAGRDPRKPLWAIAHAASKVVSAPADAPIVISDRPIDLTDFAVGAHHAELALGLARGWMARGDAEQVRQVTAAIAANYTAATRGAALTRCAMLRAGKPAPKPPNLVAMAPHLRYDWLVPLARWGCVEDAIGALKTAPMKGNHLTRFVEQLARADVSAAGRYVLDEVRDKPGPWAWKRVLVVCNQLVQLGRPLEAATYLSKVRKSGVNLPWRSFAMLAARLAAQAHRAGRKAVARGLYAWADQIWPLKERP